MVKQTVLNFKIKETNEELTSHAGLIAFGEFLQGLRLRKQIGRYLSKPGSGRGYESWEVIEPLILMLVGGGRSIEDLRVLRMDRGLKEALKIERIPSSSAVGRYLKRAYERGDLEGLKEINRRILKTAMKYSESKGHELDIDATVIKAEKREARKTYKGFKGFTPIIGHVEVGGMRFIVDAEFREGNESPNSKNLEFIKSCISRMPEGHTINRIRADAATYQAEVFNNCEEEGRGFVVGGRMDATLRETIKRIPEEEWEDLEGGGTGVKVTEISHSMEHTQKAFRLIVVRRPYQMLLPFPEFSRQKEEEEEERYKLIATNLPLRYTPNDVVRLYNQRGDASENRIKELKIDFGMERMPSGDFGANAIFFMIGVLAYNLFTLFKMLILGENHHKERAITTRWRLFNTPAHMVYHARQLFLCLSRKLAAWLCELRARIYELYQEVALE